ncbi:MAG: tRNA (adenosine(37)-N6)-dimethylallyltransferase MiaA [Muribaculaceae bacterium]|nr:tRNA (adenosine(37)-N6)-dimethylallyltransferase MiaA [Muribaculaceae bacterium]
MMKYESIAITGPTASGKTGKAVALAKYLNGEILSADSRQVYKGMDLGTGKDLEEYEDVPYHLIDIVPAGSKYNLHRFNKDFYSAYNTILTHKRLPIICGGTGMYLENILCGLHLPEVPENLELRQELEGKSLDELTEMLSTMKTLHNRTDIDTCKRAIRAIEIARYYSEHPEEAMRAERTEATPLNTLIIAIDIPREERRNRISQRLQKRLDSGMVDEIRGLIKDGVDPQDLIYYGLEYKFITLYVIGQISYEEMYSGLETAIHQFAKRQMTWFRGMERRGFKLHWIPYDTPDNIFIEKVLALYNQPD